MSPKPRLWDARHIAFVVLAVLPFLGVLGGGFVWDDHAQIEQNSHLDLASIGGYWLEAESSFAGVGRSSRYNPLGWSVFSLEAAVSGAHRSPLLFHATSLITHGLASLLLLTVLLRLSAQPADWLGRVWPLAVALFFAWCPVQASVVAWPSARFESLATCCLLAGALLVLCAKTPRSALAAGLVAALSLFAKESTLGPVLLLPAVLLVAGDEKWSALRSKFLGCATGVLVGVAAFFVLRAGAGVGLPDGLTTMDPAQVLLCELRLLHLAVWPGELSLMRPLPDDAVLGDLLAGGGVGLAILLGFAFRQHRAGRLALAGAAVLSLGTLPGALAAVRFELLPDRYTYIGQPGLCLMLLSLSLGLQARDAGRTRGKAELVGCVALCLVLCVSFLRDVKQSDRWADDVALFSWEVARWPMAPQAHYHLGLAHRLVGDHRAAEGALVRATELGPGLWQTWAELAVTSLDLGNYAKAERSLTLGVAATSGHPRLRELLVILPEEGERRGLPVEL